MERVALKKAEKEVEMVELPTRSEQPLHVKYRPKEFDQVIGQDAVVKSLVGLLKSRNLPHAFLFSGPSGTGKTTLARIMAKGLGCDEFGIEEKDAASNSGIDEIRDTVEKAQYLPLTGSRKKTIIIDECHALSKAAWQALLKAIEEPPAHVFFVLCTTELDKVPETIQTRCHAYQLQNVLAMEMEVLLEMVCSLEKIKLPAGAEQDILMYAKGSPRRMLVALSTIRYVDTIEDVRYLLSTSDTETSITDLCKCLARSNSSFPQTMSIIKRLGDVPSETVRLAIIRYLSRGAIERESDKEKRMLIGRLETFLMVPWKSQDELAPLLVAVSAIFQQP